MNITRKRVLKFVCVLLLLAGALTYAYYLYFLHLVRIPTGSMANTLIIGDRLVVKKRAFGEIVRGDVIVFNYPGDSETKYIGRVIGLPNETIETRGKLVYINGVALAEQRVTVMPNYGDQLLEEFSTEGSGPYRVFYTPEDDYGGAADLDGGHFGSNGPFQIPANEYFVMGDCRGDSQDSRYRGPVPRSLIYGKATMIYWSAGRDKTGNDTVRWERLFTTIGRN